MPLPIMSAFSNHHGHRESKMNPPGSTIPMTTPTTASLSKQTNHHHHLQQTQYSSNFGELYEHLCAMQGQLPHQAVKSSIVGGETGPSLHLNADRLKSIDWEPVFGAIKLNRNLKSINIHSKHLLPGDNDQSESNGRASRGSHRNKKVPSIRLKERANKLCRSVRDCLCVSTCLSQVEIFNIPLYPKDCSQIAKGLRVNKTLKSLSLDSCLIGDEGLAVICKEIQNSSNLNHINFSSCLLTHEGANILATLIKVQALKRHNEAWKDSLKYGRTDLESMLGIRRITINCNPLVGDRGVQALADAFKSDLWLKALDLQDCGITTQGANYLLDGLKFNAMMHVLDVRLNPSIDRETLQKIMEQVMINSTDNSTVYEWMELIHMPVSVHQQQQQQQQALSMMTAARVETAAMSAATAAGMPSRRVPPVSKRLKKRRTTNASFSIKPRVHSAASSVRIKRSKSTGSVTLNKSGLAAAGAPSNHPVRRHHTSNGGSHWKVANRLRASRNNRNSPTDNDFVDEEEELEDEEEMVDELAETHMGETDARMPCLSSNYTKEATGEDNEVDEDDSRHPSGGAGGVVVSSTVDYGRFGSSGKRPFEDKNSRQRKVLASSNECLINKSDLVSNLDKMKNSSVKDLLVILQKQIDSKSQLEEMLLKLQDQNTNLQMEISNLKSENMMLKSKIDEQQKTINRQSTALGSDNEPNLNRTSTSLDDEKALEIIEMTLLKYQNFLDFLRNCGFGRLIELGELNQQRQQQHSKSEKGARSRSDYQDKNKEEYELAFLTAKMMMMGGRRDDDESMSESMISLPVNYKLSMDGSMSMHESTLNSMANFDADGETSQDVDALISSALELSRSYRRMNSSSVNTSTLSLVTNLGPARSKNKNIKSPIDLDETNKENLTTADQSTLLNSDDLNIEI